MPSDRYPDPREEDIIYEDRRISRPDASLPDWEVPDTTYRPVPIVWFTGAFILHLIIIIAVLVLFSSLGPIMTVGSAVLAAIGIGVWTWERGMKDAGTGWKAATVIVLLFQIVFVYTVSVPPA